MPFDAETNALAIIRALRAQLLLLDRSNPGHADNARRAASSIVHNVSEGRRRVGKDRLHQWRIAAGSAAELRSAIQAAVAWGWLGEEDVAEALELIDRELAMLWRLTNPRRPSGPSGG